MIPLDSANRWLSQMPESARIYLNEIEYGEFCRIPEDEAVNQLTALLHKPIAAFTSINDVYFRTLWAEVIKKLCPGSNLRLLEIASGDADMIPQAMARMFPESHYITANMNKSLTKSLINKTKSLPVKIDVIEDDAANIGNHLGSGLVDIIAFQHAVNDVMQAILCDREGVDTVYSDWMETLPKMIEILQGEIKNNTLEQHVKTPFLELIKVLLGVLKKGGTIVMHHYMFQLDLDWGYPPELFERIIPITREWIKELKECKEIFFDGFEHNWWMFLEKV